MLNKFLFSFLVFSSFCFVNIANAAPNTELPDFVLKSVSKNCTTQKTQTFYEEVNNLGFDVFNLNNGRKLWIITCFVGASNSSDAVVITENAQAKRILFKNTIDNDDASDLVDNPTFDSKRLILTEESRMGANDVMGSHWKLSGNNFLLIDDYETENGITKKRKAP